MKPLKSILDESFAYTPSTATTVEETWRRYGWQPLTEQERKSRRQRKIIDDARVVQMKPRRSA